MLITSVLGGFVLSPCAHAGQPHFSRTVSQHGITWTFAEERQIGQFVNGDYWVVGPVTITGISPASVVAGDGSTRNGSMVNPVRNTAQGFDSRSSFWNASTNVGASLPLRLDPGSSLISTNSLDSAVSASYVGVAAILTVLASPASEGDFRPAYFGTDKTLRHNVADLNYGRLGSVSPVASTPSLATVEEFFERPWVDFGLGWGGRTLHPAGSMPTYGRDLSTRVGIGALMLQLNFSNAQKQKLMVRFTQLGIDNHGVVSHPGGRTTWEADGGHCMGRKFPILFAGAVLGDQAMLNVGQKSGEYLWSAKPGGGRYGPGDLPPDYLYFQEDMQTFYVDPFMVDLELVTSVSGPTLGATSTSITIDGLPKWAGQPEHQYVEITSGPGAGQRRYIRTSNFDRRKGGVTTVNITPAWDTVPVTGSSQYHLRGYEESQIGLAEWGIRHASNPRLSLPSWGSDYRAINGVSYPGWILAAYFMGLREQWNHDALFDYVERWMQRSLPGGDAVRSDPTWDKFTTNMWVAYREGLGSGGSGGSIGEPPGQDGPGDPVSYAPEITSIGGESVSSPGNLSFQVAENETLTLAVSASDADGDTLTYSATGLPSGAGFSGQTFSWRPTYDQAGTHQVTFTVSDGQHQDSETVSINVVNVNRAPTLAQIGDRSVDENTTLTFSVSASDADGDTVNYSATGLPSGADFAGGSFRWTPSASQVGSHDITFVASDGNSQDSETVTILVAGSTPDGVAPVVARRSPESDAIQVSLNHLITLHVTDSGQGVAPDSVVIRVDDTVVYQGDIDVYESASGRCSRSGTTNDYRFIYQAHQAFPFDHTVDVRVDATDRAGNAMSSQSYSFTTQMRAFGSNWSISAGSGISGRKSGPSTASDASGNLWAVWCSGAEGSRDIYVSRMPAGSTTLSTPVAITTATGDQCQPDVACGPDGTVHVAWQDRQRGNWDIFAASSSDGGVTWSRPVQVTDSDHNETFPALTADGQSPSRVYIAWQDDRDGQSDIFAISSTNGFVDTLSSRLTTDPADQITPDIVVDAENTAYVVWADMRNGQADLYGARSGAPGWPNIPVVTAASVQSRPVMAIDESSGVLHLVWVDDAPGDTDIYYAAFEGLPESPVSGRSIIDDTSGADQFDPALVYAGGSRIFACWQDRRHSHQRPADTDLFMAELGPGLAGTNIFVGDGGTNSGQSEPAIGLDSYGNPYLVWTDARAAQAEIYYAATTFMNPTPLDSKQVSASVGATVGVDPAAIDEPDDVSIVVPAGACQSDVRISISAILNPPVAPAACLGSYDFGPSGIEFDVPVTVTIPYRFSGSGNSATPYWYDSLTGALSQQGITDIENLVIASNLNALRFKTTHFTPFYLVADDPVSSADGGSSDGGGGGGCSLSPGGEGTAGELIVPHAVIAIAMILWRRRDRRRRRVIEAFEG